MRRWPGVVGMLLVWTGLGLAGVTSLPTGLTAQPTPLPDSLDATRYGRIGTRGLTVRFAPRDSLVAERVLSFLVEQRELPGLPAPRDVTAVLAHTPEVLDALTGGVVPEWRAGVAVPSRRLLIVPTGEGPRILDPEGRRVLRHEWAHLGLHGYLGELRVPRWFDEGYAQWASGGFDATEAWRLRVALATGAAPAFDSLTLRWPRSRGDADVAYLLAASAVTYLMGDSGARGLTVFLQRWRADRSFESAFRETFGVTTGQFEEDWQKHVEDRYGWLFVLSHSTVFWMILTLMLLLMVRIRQQHDKDRMAQLRAEELPDRPAYWEWDPGTGPEAWGEGSERAGGPPEGGSGVDRPT